MNYKGKEGLVLGLGDTGLSLSKWLARRGARLRVADTRPSPPGAQAFSREFPGVPLHCGPYRPELFAGLDFIAMSPGVPLADIAPYLAGRSIPVLGDIELFAQALAERPARVLAITGTNGKTTVTSLTGAMARAAGSDCEVAGNIGPPVLDAWMRREDEGRMPDLWVLELSSFQLETTSTLAPDAAVVLNVTEDHLDRYAGMDAYAAAKARIFYGSGVQVLNRDDARSLAMAVPGRRKLSFGLGPAHGADEYGMVQESGRSWLVQGRERLLALDEMQIAGLHNGSNALASLALCRALGLPLGPLLDALRRFRALPHRVEPVAEVRGVHFYDDSKGTNVGATAAALAGLAHKHGKVIVIAGGEGKGQDFSPLRPALAAAARSIVLIGRDAALIEAAVATTGLPVQRAGSMEEAVEKAFREAHPGDAVLLSPACASFDMFKNYKHRGEMFCAAVHALAHAPSH
jgi:UDP-N-acetylmuramoylalanine--D-glutamate ligase